MKIVFVNCYFNHHQKPFSDAMVALGADYSFLETMPMPEYRRALGYQELPKPEYVHSWLEEPARCEKLIDEADTVLFSSAPEKLFRRCFGQGKLLFRVTERPLKRQGEWQKFLPRLLRWRWRNPGREGIRLLSASAFAPSDYAKFGLFRGRAYRWGYFPHCNRQADTERLLAGKTPGSMLWAGRFLDWKHPDDALRAASWLRHQGYPVLLKMIGTGPMEKALQEMREQLDLEGSVSFPGSMTPAEVRREMDKAELFLFTSDRREGWGAVLNEAMDSACAIVAGHAAGATPYLIRPGQNGLVYHSGDWEALAHCLKSLLDSRQSAAGLGREARNTILTEWNAEYAARSLLALAEALRSGTSAGLPASAGPCSKAEIIKEDWFYASENHS